MELEIKFVMFDSYFWDLWIKGFVKMHKGDMPLQSIIDGGIGLSKLLNQTLVKFNNANKY